VKESWRQLMEGATRLTRAGKLKEATAAIQRALGMSGGASPMSPSPHASAFRPAAEADGDVIDVEARVVEEGGAEGVKARAAADPVIGRSGFGGRDPETEPTIVDFAPAEAPVHEAPAASPSRAGGEPGRFIDGSFTNPAGSRPYKLFVPSGAASGPRPMVVMLHGCKQNPADFAAGTHMNDLAQARGWIVLYPGQQKAANQMGCWNWFQEADQQRGRGEPSIIADMTRQVAGEHGVDMSRIYVAGLSAGGAMAAIMATTYPELFAAAGIHSGLPHAAANDLVSALQAMKKGPSSRATQAATRQERVVVPTIVFHGDRDTTVHPCNGDEVIARARFSSSQAAMASNGGRVESQAGQVPGGHAYTRKIHRDERGVCDAEHWIIHGAGHAWSGGSAKGSYTDPRGPDASAQMLRFFEEHPRAG
jgi:poly(hydroxyalkanoate) depolymerase family esterase